MDWIEIAVHTTTMGADLVAEVLMSAGAAGTAIVDRNDLPEPVPGMWDMVDEAMLASLPEDVLVKAYFDTNAHARERVEAARLRLAELAAMALGFDVGTLEVALQTVHEEDWAENWKQYYKPLRIGERLVIRPTWEAFDAKMGDLVISLDPGMAFGTGTHETTAMCLRLLERYVREGMEVLDVGTGSGILAIAAALLGAKHTLAIDLDETAVAVAHRNVAYNGQSHRVTVSHGDLLQGVDARADVVVANIIASVIILLAPAVRAHLKPSGVFICSGIIRDREQDVREAFAQAGFAVTACYHEGEWVAMAAIADVGEDA